MSAPVFAELDKARRTLAAARARCELLRGESLAAQFAAATGGVHRPSGAERKPLSQRPIVRGEVAAFWNIAGAELLEDERAEIVDAVMATQVAA